MPPALNLQSQQMVASLLAYFEKERDFGGPLIPLTAVRERVADALQLNISTVSRISSDVRKGTSLYAPFIKRVRSKPVTGLDDNHQTAIRDTIYEMYERKEHITLKTLLNKLKVRVLFDGNISSLWKILKQIGFKWRKDDPRRGLMELSHIAFKRVDFLRSYIDSKKEGMYQFVYLVETWVFQDGTIGRSWEDEDVRTVKTTKVESKRYVILNAGNENGFIQGAELIFSTKNKFSDYHGEMNSDNFFHWFEHKLIPNLEEPSIIVMDNASYHSVTKDKVPTCAWKKVDIQTWLTNKQIIFDPHLLKSELLQKVYQNKPSKSYVIDELAMNNGHKILRLPPYHCIFNPIEHVWGIAKGYYNKHAARSGTSADNCIMLWQEALAQITPEVRANSIRHTDTEILKWWKREVHLDSNEICPLIINISPDDDDDDSESELDLLE